MTKSEFTGLAYAIGNNRMLSDKVKENLAIDIADNMPWMGTRREEFLARVKAAAEIQKQNLSPPPGRENG